MEVNTLSTRCHESKFVLKDHEENEKRKSSCPFASAKKLSKRKKGSNSFNKDRADLLAASDRGSYFEEAQEKLIAVDEEEQNRWKNETGSAGRGEN